MTPQQPLSPQPALSPAPARRPGRSRRRVAALAVVLLLLAGAGYWWLSGPPAAAPPLDPPLPTEIADPDIRRAIERARKAVLDDPRSAEAWGNLGVVLTAHEYNRESLVCFGEAAKLDPANVRWPSFAGHIALHIDPDRAIPHLRRAKEIGHPDPDQQSQLNFRLADALFELNQLDEAERLYQEELERRPGDPRASLGLGLIAFARKDDPAAVRFLLTARGSPYARRTATAHLARLARLRGDTTAADALDREVDALPPIDPQWGDGLESVIKAARVESIQVVRDAARLEMEENYAEAAKLFLDEFRQWPSCGAATSAGLNLARCARYDEALELLREAERLDPKDSSPQYRLAQVFHTLGNLEAKRSPGSDRAKELFREAADHARRATELKPDHALAYLVWGTALLDLGEPAQAVAPLRLGVKCRPEVFDLQLVLAKALLASGHNDDAAVHLKNARELRPQDPGVVELSARLKKP